MSHSDSPSAATIKLDRVPIRRALISVYDKAGLIDLARALADHGVEIVSTGSTAATIAAEGIAVTPVEQVTGFPEVLEGRVKTLHPKIHSGILADRRKPDHVDQLNELGIAPFDLVVCNLYPFEQTVASGASFDECVEQIDIGGPSMVRAAAKNHPSVAVVVDPENYPAVIDALDQGGFDLAERRELAADAFLHTAEYDAAISSWFVEQLSLGDDVAEDAEDAAAFPEVLGLAYERADVLRYGENPHQSAAIYRDLPAETDGDQDGAATRGIANARQLHGKAMSFNNYADGDAALRAAYDHEDPCVAIIKHANPCGIAVAADVAEAHRKAHACDPVSAFGGVIAVNRPVTVELAKQITPIFTEVVLAPAYEEGALEVLSTKKNLRVLEVEPPVAGGVAEFKQISGGLLVQDRDQIDAPGDDPANWQLVSGEAADAATMADLVFAWRTVRAVRSNAILLVKDQASVGVGMGQVNRVDSCKLAVERANTLGGRATGDADAAPAASDVDSAGGANAADVLDDAPEQRSIGSVAASDAFFPFADGLQILLDAGVKAVVQPGGSIRDDQSIEAAKAAGVTMYLTGTRHFAH